jgi:hypothetical protein
MPMCTVSFKYDLSLAHLSTCSHIHAHQTRVYQCPRLTHVLFSVQACDQWIDMCAPDSQVLLPGLALDAMLYNCFGAWYHAYGPLVMGFLCLPPTELDTHADAQKCNPGTSGTR